MAQLYSRSTGLSKKDETSAYDMAALDLDEQSFERLYGLSSDLSYWQAERYLIIQDFYKKACTKFAIYSVNDFEGIYCRLVKATCIHELSVIESSLIHKYSLRTEDEQRFINSWLAQYELPRPHNSYSFPLTYSKRTKHVVLFIINTFERLCHRIHYSLNCAGCLS